jgi:hypothetical protein
MNMQKLNRSYNSRACSLPTNRMINKHHACTLHGNEVIIKQIPPDIVVQSHSGEDYQPTYDAAAGIVRLPPPSVVLSPGSTENADHRDMGTCLHSNEIACDQSCSDKNYILNFTGANWF